ncbi:MAG: hypothetical protein ABI193_09495 [Minicystis sp.]
MARALVIGSAAIALVLGSAAAQAQPKAPRPGTDPAEILRGGDDLIAQAPVAATLSNTWSAPLSVSWVLSGRLFAGPIAQGVSSFVVARVLNGSTWSVLLGLELAAVRRLGHGWGWLERVSFNADQTYGFNVPAGCSGAYAARGCGLGLGGTDELRGRLRGTPWVFSLTGGWIQGRVATDEKRTVIESTWLFSPVAAQIEGTATLGPLRARGAIGPGLYFGMHIAHVHPETTKDDLGVPWHGLYPLDGGIGLGLRADASLTIGRVFSLGGTLIVAPMLGRSLPDIDPVAAPVRSSAGRGLLSWRTASFGATVELPNTAGTRIGLRYWAGELSSRPLPSAGHQAIALRWEVPLRP